LGVGLVANKYNNTLLAGGIMQCMSSTCLQRYENVEGKGKKKKRRMEHSVISPR